MWFLKTKIQKNWFIIAFCSAVLNAFAFIATDCIQHLPVLLLLLRDGIQPCCPLLILPRNTSLSPQWDNIAGFEKSAYSVPKIC